MPHCLAFPKERDRLTWKCFWHVPTKTICWLISASSCTRRCICWPLFLWKNIYSGTSDLSSNIGMPQLLIATLGTLRSLSKLPWKEGACGWQNDICCATSEGMDYDFIVNCMCLFGQHLGESREKRILVSQIPVHIKCGSKWVNPSWITLLSKAVCTLWLHGIKTAKGPYVSIHRYLPLRALFSHLCCSYSTTSQVSMAAFLPSRWLCWRLPSHQGSMLWAPWSEENCHFRF